MDDRTFHAFSATSIDGEQVDLGEFRGGPVLVVNVASKCGLTPQYDGLQKLQDEYKDRGFTVLAFPCDQFGHQEPLDDVLADRLGVTGLERGDLDEHLVAHRQRLGRAQGVRPQRLATGRLR